MLSKTPRIRGRWQSLDAAEALRKLETDPQGLEQEEAQRRLHQHGRNQIGDVDRAHPLKILLHQFTSPLIYVLMAAMVISFFIERWEDAVVIAVVLVINATVGFFQEYRAEGAIAALMQLVAPLASVRRAGHVDRIDSRDIVPGDVVLLEAGDLVPADLRFVSSQRLEIDESLLTGESIPVAKGTDALDGADDPGVADCINMGFTGTAVTKGRAEGVVVATGSGTEMGRIAQQIRSTERRETPLQRRIGRFGRWISVVILAASCITLGIGLLRGEGLVDMFLVAVAIAVSAIPEGLPVVMTIALAVSVRRMARRNAIVRRLPAVETLGSCSVIVTDKTGTLTRNQMTVQSIWAGRRRYDVTGLGLESGEILENGDRVSLDGRPTLRGALVAAMVGNDAEIEETARGDPTEIALLAAAAKAGLTQDDVSREFPMVDRVPFEADQRFGASVHDSTDGENVVFATGAPERIVEMCGELESDDGVEPLTPDEILTEANALAARGMRVLATAVGYGAEARASMLSGEPGGMRFLGLLGMLDPPRAEAPEALRTCGRAGIRVIMVTGDHAVTAEAIGRVIGLTEADDSRVISGVELARLSDEELGEVLEGTRIFSRIAPADKLRIVRILEESGHTVAVTGDGVNDAPALKAAHVGAAMGATGSDVAKEASEMVLADDNFATVGAAIEEGRTAFANLRNATFFLVSCGVAELLAILGSLALRLPLPFLPAQILWLNVVTNGIEDVALALEPPERKQMDEPPRSPREGIISRVLIERTVIVGLLMAIGTLAIFYSEWDGSDGNLAYAQVAALTTMVMFQFFHAGNCRSERRSAFGKSPFSNRFLFIGVAVTFFLHFGALHWGPSQRFLGLQPLTAETWLKVTLVALCIVPVVELHKLVRARGGSRP